MKKALFVFVVLLVGVALEVRAQGGASESAQVWKALAQPAFDPATSAAVKDVTLERDRIRIILTDGTIQFTQPVNGIVFGATFRGNGRLTVAPPDAIETQQLRFFNRQDPLELTFTEATFSFTDNTFKEIASQVQPTGSGAVTDELYTSRQQQREDVGAEILPRMFRSVLSSNRAATALFVADLKTKERGWVLVSLDSLQPEEITIGRWGDTSFGRIFDTWMSFPAGGRSASEAFHDPLAKAEFLIRGYRINAEISGGAELAATARVQLDPRLAGERVLLFNLDSNLRVDKVTDAQEKPLEFYQARERKDRNQSYGEYVAVILPAPARAGEPYQLTFHYAGKRVIRQVGPGNYFCQSFGWYPALLTTRTGIEMFADRVDFELNFRSPKRYTLVATGNKVSETTDGDWALSTWKSDIPLAVAGFAYGDYKTYNEKVGAIDVDVYANRQPDDFMKSIQMLFDNPMPTPSGIAGPSLAAVGQLTPAALVKQMGTEMGNTLRVFEAYFGPYPYKHLSITNIPYSYGQGWPTLIYLSALSFLDSTQRHNLGIRDQVELTDFFRAHESSHQWWGHRVGWKSYHDQWLSEGFAEFSGNLYVQFSRNRKEYLERLRKNKEQLQTRDLHNRVYESVGPVWMGLRLASSESPGAYQYVVYFKGGYILHMLRMMMQDPRNPQDPDRLFKAMMQDFCKTFENKPASTEDFKAVVEKYSTSAMDLEGNHRMDWFFRQYVYGTGIPQYEFRYQLDDAGGGKVKLTGTLTRSGVPDDWIDILPLYIHRGDAAMRLGFIRAKQKQTPFEVVLPSRPEKLSLNANQDILADVKQ